MIIKGWSQSDWKVKGIFAFFLLRGILFVSVLTFYTVMILKFNVDDVGGLIKKIITEQNISTSTILIGAGMWLIRLIGIYYAWLLVNGVRYARIILELMTGLLIMLSLFYFFFPQFLSSSNETILDKNIHYFLSEHFLLGIIVTFCNILVLIGLRSKSTVKYANVV